MLNFNFRRFTKETKFDGFKYNTTDKRADIDNSASVVSMDHVGYNVSFNIRNFMAEDILLNGNLRSKPTRIASLRRDGARPQDYQNNTVIITVFSTENSNTPDAKNRLKRATKTEIVIPGKMLNQGSVFVNDLDCYISTESQHDATRELMARDISDHGNDSINIPETMVSQDPETLYIDHKELVEHCIKRQDKILIRVGCDLRYGEVPDIIKSMRVAIVDSYFVPYTSYKLLYDPSLNPDEFVIENLYLASTKQYKSTFTDLANYGYHYLSHDQFDTMFGKFYGMAIFANDRLYREYVYKRKTQERFNDETLYVAERSGDPRLKEELDRVNRDLSATKDIVAEQEQQIATLRADNKTLKGTVRDREESIQKIRQQHDAKMASEAVLTELDNDRERIEVDAKKVENDRVDQEHREKTTKVNHKATTLKIIADMLKSSWGIATASLGGVLAIATLLKKYNVKVSMST